MAERETNKSEGEIVAPSSGAAAQAAGSTKNSAQVGRPAKEPKRRLCLAFRRLKNAAPSWIQLSHLGSHPYLRWLPLWIVVVPAIVKVLIFLESKLQRGSQLGDIPFSLKMFYFSALAALGANLILSWKCPTIVKQYANFTSFKDSGKGSPQLLEEFLVILRQHKPDGHSLAQNLAHVCREYTDTPLASTMVEAISQDPKQAYVVVPSIRIRNEHLADAFWSFHGFAADLSPSWRYLCGLAYLTALSLLAIVLAKNAWIVIEFLNSRT